jgi:hypothetical protein
MNDRIIPNSTACSHESCPGQARWRPVLEVRYRNDTPARACQFTDVGLCELHNDRLQIPEILSNEGWKVLTRHIREAGFPAPRRDLTILSFVAA